MSIYDNVIAGYKIAGTRKSKSEFDDIVERSLRGANLWEEVKQRLEPPGRRPVRRPAAAAVHRPGDRRRAAGAADGRAVLGARPDLDAGHRGPDQRTQEQLHDRHRHPQHAAGRPGLGPHRLLQPRPASASPAGWSSTTTPRRSSPTPPRRPPRTTFPADSADPRGTSTVADAMPVGAAASAPKPGVPGTPSAIAANLTGHGPDSPALATLPARAEGLLTRAQIAQVAQRIGGANATVVSPPTFSPVSRKTTRRPTDTAWSAYRS